MRLLEPSLDANRRLFQRLVGDAAHDQRGSAQDQQWGEPAAANDADASDGDAAQNSRDALALRASVDALRHRDDIERRSFHDEVLQAGCVPLDLLTKHARFGLYWLTGGRAGGAPCHSGAGVAARERVVRNLQLARRRLRRDVEGGVTKE